MRISQMRKQDSASSITLNSGLEQHSVTIFKFASFVYFAHVKTTINIHMRIFQMRKQDSASYITLYGRLEQNSATILKFASFVYFVQIKTSINIHMRISQMRKQDSASFSYTLQSFRATLCDHFEICIICLHCSHKNNNKYSYENFPNEKI